MKRISMILLFMIMLPAASFTHERMTGGLNILLLAPIVYGNRTDSEVITKIQSKLNSYSTCYASNFTHDNAASFKIRFRYTILWNGKVSDIQILFSGTKNQGMTDCLTSILAQIAFDAVPKTEGNSVVEQSILFRYE